MSGWLLDFGPKAPGVMCSSCVVKASGCFCLASMSYLISSNVLLDSPPSTIQTFVSLEPGNITPKPHRSRIAPPIAYRTARSIFPYLVMGNDGGSIPTRRELVKSAARAPTLSEMKATALEALTHAWSHDPLTSEPLDMENVVSDWRGRLYNYETILKSLMPSDSDEKDSAPPPSLVNTANGEWQELTFDSTGIKSLRDVIKLKFKRYEPAGEKGKDIWACPMTLKELGPATKAVYLVPCGHVFSEVGIKTIQEEACPECSEPFKAENVVPILPTEKTEVQRLTKRMDSLRESGLSHSLKKDKSQGKRKKRKAEGALEDSKSGENDGKAKKSKQEPSKTAKSDAPSRASGINNPMTASLTAKVLAEQEQANKRRRLAAAR